jgi:hypothetical protein
VLPIENRGQTFRAASQFGMCSDVGNPLAVDPDLTLRLTQPRQKLRTRSRTHAIFLQCLGRYIDSLAFLVQTLQHATIITASGPMVKMEGRSQAVHQSKIRPLIGSRGYGEDCCSTARLNGSRPIYVLGMRTGLAWATTAGPTGPQRDG